MHKRLRDANTRFVFINNVNNHIILIIVDADETTNLTSVTFSLTKLYLYPLNWALGSNSSLAIDNDLHKLTLRSLQTQPRSWWRGTGSRPLPSYLTGRLFWPLSQQCLNLMSDPDATLLRLYFLLCKLIVCALTHTAPGNQTQ